MGRGGARAIRSGILLAAVLLTAAAPSAALATGGDVSSTHAVLTAGYTLGRESEARMGAMRRAIHATKSKLLHQCGAIAKESPQDEQSYKLSYEAAGALWAAGYGADRGPIRKFVGATRGLHWSRPNINRAFEAFVRGLQGLSTLPTPPLCKDIATWKASGYTKLPAETISFDARVEKLEAKAELGLLAPYAQGADRALLRQDQRIDTKVLNFETEVGGDAWYALTEGLELNP
jgi:hypothetical protein